MEKDDKNIWSFTPPVELPKRMNNVLTPGVGLSGEVNASILFRTLPQLSGTPNCHRPHQYIGEITECIIPIITRQKFDSKIVNPLYRIRDPSGDVRFLEIMLQSPQSRIWYEQSRQLNDLIVGGTIIYLRPTDRFTKFRNGEMGFSIGLEELDPCRIFMLPFNMQKGLHLVRRILYFRGKMCWSYECKRRNFGDDVLSPFNCDECGIAQYCDWNCQMEDSIHRGICESRKMKDLDQQITDAMDAYTRDLRRFLGNEKVEKFKAAAYKHIL